MDDKVLFAKKSEEEQKQEEADAMAQINNEINGKEVEDKQQQPMEARLTKEWVSVSEMAKMQGVSKQTIYNRIREGLYETQTFQRGKMNGILIHLA